MAVAKTFREILLGAPVDPQHEPDQYELYRKLAEVEAQAALNGALYFEDTLSQLNAVSGAVEGDTGFVLDDGSPANNGVYRRGASTWSKTAELPEAFSDAVSALAAVAVEEAARIAADAALDDAIDALDVRIDALEAPGNVGTADIADDAVTNAKLSEMAESRIKGRTAGAGTGNPQDLTPAQARTVLELGALAELDTVAGPQIEDGSVTLPKLADRTEATLIGRASGAGTGAPQELTPAQGRTVLGLGTAATTNADAYAPASEVTAREAADNLGDIIRLSSVTGTANAASGTVQAAQAHISISGRQRVQTLWPVTNTAANPTLTIAATAYTIKRRGGGNVAAGDLVGGAVYDLVHDPDAVNTLRLMGGVAIADITGLSSDLDTRATTAALNDEAARAQAAEALIATQSRPGDLPTAYGAEIVGAISSTTPYASSDVVVDADMGSSLQLTTAAYVAPRQPIPLEPGRVYRAHWEIKRLSNPSDPLNDAVTVGLRWLTETQSGVSGGDVTVQTYPLTVAMGVQRLSVTASLDVAGVDHVISAGANYARPWVRTFGVDHETAVGRVEFIDITEAWMAQAAADDAQAAADEVAEDLAQEISDRELLIRADGTGFSFEDTRGGVLFDVHDGILSLLRRLFIDYRGYGLQIEDEVGRIAISLTADEMSMAGRLLMSPDGVGASFEDAAGRVAGSIGPDGVSVGGSTISEKDEGISVQDRAGRQYLSVNADGGRVLGRLVMDSETLADWMLDREAVFTPSARPLAKWRRDRADIAASRGQASKTQRTMLVMGDSNSMGWVVLGAGNHRRQLSWPSQFAALSPEWLGASAEDFFGRALTADSGYATYDPRMSVGAGWNATGPASVGGEMWQNGTTTNALSFTPNIAWDTVVVVFKCAASASAQIGVSGDLDAVSLGAGIQIETFTADQVDFSALEIRRVSGNVRVIGAYCYDSSQSGLSVINGGRSGWASGDYAAVVTDAASIAPDVCCIALGLNDLAQSVTPIAFMANMRTLIEAMQAAGSDIVLMVSMTPDGVPAYPWAQYVRVMYDLARYYSLPVVDISARFGAYSDANAAGFITDAFHPNSIGAVEQALPVIDLMLR